MIDRLAEIMRHQQVIQQQKFYVSFAEDGRLTSVFTGAGEPPENTIEIDVDLAEKFLSGQLMKNKYKAVQLGDKYVLQKADSAVDITTSHSFYKVPQTQMPNMVSINQTTGSLTLHGDFDSSSVLYVCEKDCFHILYDVVVCQPNISVYPITPNKQLDIFVPAHVTNVGVLYE